MTNKEFKEYVFDQKRQGMSETQIARNLGMTVEQVNETLNGNAIKKEKKKPVIATAPKIHETKPEVSESKEYYPPKLGTTADEDADSYLLD